MTLTSKGDLSDAEWGYCADCKRDVELRPNGHLITHNVHSGPGYTMRTCEGSLQKPGVPPTEGGSRNGPTAAERMRQWLA